MTQRYEKPCPQSAVRTAGRPVTGKGGGIGRIVVAVALCVLSSGNVTEALAQTDVGMPALLLVQAVEVQVLPGQQRISLTGEINARSTLDASFPAAGRLESVSVQEGDHVVKDQELARIESVSQQQNLRSKEAALVTAQADLAQAKSDFERQDALLERGATTSARRDEAEDALLSAEAGVAEAQAARELARKDRADTVLLAPEDALVMTRSAEVGQVVGAAETVIELALGSQYDAVVDVPEVLLTEPKPAPPVQLDLIDITAPPFMGEVREISPLVDPDLGTIRVKISVIDPPAEVSIGASVRGTVEFAEPPVVMLPFFALTASKAGPAVWVIDPDSQTVALRQVDVQRHETGKVLIRSGLSDGEMVVVRGGQLLYEGQKVRVAPWISEMGSK